MSSFEMSGKVLKKEVLTSQKGNKYIVFKIEDEAGRIFEMSLFGDGMSLGDKLKPSTEVIIKGSLSSREFQDKNGKTRYAPDLRPQWIEASSDKLDGGGVKASAASALDDLPF